MRNNSHALFRCSFEPDASVRNLCFVLIWHITNYGWTWVRRSDTGITQRSPFIVKAVRIEHLRVMEYHQTGCNPDKSNPDLADVLNRQILLSDDFCGVLCPLCTLFSRFLVQR